MCVYPTNGINHSAESGRDCAQGWWQLVLNCCKYNEVADTICVNTVHVLCVKTVGVGRGNLLVMFLFPKCAIQFVCVNK